MHARSHYRNEYLERLQDEKSFREEMYVIEKIIETEERKRKRHQDMEFEQFKVLQE